MCSRLVVAAFLLVSLTFVAAGVERPPLKSDESYGHQCKRGEEYSKCGTCDLSCADPTPVCTDECKIGCFCIKGLMRDSKGRCISPSDCPKKCS